MGRGARLLVGVAWFWVACSSNSNTELNPAGPPMIRQVFVEEKVEIQDTDRVRTGLAFGDHPQIKEADDDREVTRAVASRSQEIRIVFDELLRGNPLEEIGCADGSFSAVPAGADPDDIAKCSGMGTELARCSGEHAVCLDAAGDPIGILDGNSDGAADNFRMIDYSGNDCDDPTTENPIDPGTMMQVSDGSSRDLAVKLTCGGVDIPLGCASSFYNPSGNQLIPGGPIGIRGLGPAIILRPRGLRTSSMCSLTVRSEVVDTDDGQQVCAPAGGDPAAGCDPGDTSLIEFRAEAMATTSTVPANGATNVALRAPGSQEGRIRIDFNAELDAASLTAITVNDGAVDVAVTRTKAADPGTSATIAVPGGFAANETYTVTVGTGVSDAYGGMLPMASSFSFTTGNLALASSVPANGATNVALVTAPGPDATIRLNFNTSIDAGTLGAITLSDGNANVAITSAIAGNDPGAVILTIAGGFVAATTYTVTIGTGLTDFAGTALPAQAQISFSTVP